MDEKTLRQKLTEAQQAAAQVKNSLCHLAQQIVYYADVLSGDTSEILDAKSLDCVYTIRRLADAYDERLDDYDNVLRDIEYLKEDIEFLENE